MKLQSINYTEYKKDPKQWVLSGLALGSINLIVGKNASGKTRILNVINGLARMLSGKQKVEFLSGEYDVIFQHNGQTLSYFLEIQDRKVIREEFKQQRRTLLKRGPGGRGTIYHERQEASLRFQTPDNDLAASARVDSIQHGFLEPLRDWGLGVRHYLFGETMGRNVVAFLTKDGPPADPADPNAVVALFLRGRKEFPHAFDDAVREDMREIGYEISEVGVTTPSAFTLQSSVPLAASPSVMFVKEKDLGFNTDATVMSQGMFRSLAIIIHLNYSIMASSKPTCILIDDIGEGLDFDRSCRLIELLRRKLQGSSGQLIMSTNDRFVMNKVPLKEWSIVHRKRSTVEVRNYENSRAKFEEFEFMGLNNFDFLQFDFLNNAKKRRKNRK